MARIPKHRGAARRLAALCAAGLALLFFAMPAGAEAAKAAGGVRNSFAETVTLVPTLTLLALLGIVVHIDPYIRPGNKRDMRVILALVLSLVAQSFIEYRMVTGADRWLARTLSAIYGYAVRPVILAMFLRLIQPKMKLGWAWALVGVNAAVNATALLSHICFWIQDNHYHAGPLNRMCLWVSMLLLAVLFVMSMRAFRPQKRMDALVPMLVVALIVGGVALDFRDTEGNQPVTYLTIAVAISCVMYYIWLHLQFVREHEQALVAGQRVQLMLSQIKPHFLHNSLAVIAELCDSDPATAKVATIMFSKYLRGNMNSIDEARSIPFERELSHTRLYLEIEQLRFEEALQVRYDIACTDFNIPALTVEPLAENAVRHGVRENPGGRGTVTIRTRELPDRYEVSVQDDGPGFDPARMPDDGKPHVGIENVRERLMQVCGGTLVIESAPGAGTTATIRLPK